MTYGNGQNCGECRRAVEGDLRIEASSRCPGGFVLTTETLLPRSRAELFEFFGDAFQLERITPPWLRFAVTTPRPIEMREGTLIDYRLRLHGFPVRWRSKISAWQPPFRFVDEQVRGPYRHWIHEHTFTDEDGGTRIRDCVEYGVPLGRIVHWLLVRRDLQRIFSYRHASICRIFNFAPANAPLPSQPGPERAGGAAKQPAEFPKAARG